MTSRLTALLATLLALLAATPAPALAAVSADPAGAQNRAQAQAVIREVLGHPSIVDSERRVVDVYNAAGRGVRYRRDTGAFQGSLNSVSGGPDECAS